MAYHGSPQHSPHCHVIPATTIGRTKEVFSIILFIKVVGAGVTATHVELFCGYWTTTRSLACRDQFWKINMKLLRSIPYLKNGLTWDTALTSQTPCNLERFSKISSQLSYFRRYPLKNNKNNRFFLIILHSSGEHKLCNDNKLLEVCNCNTLGSQLASTLLY